MAELAGDQAAESALNGVLKRLLRAVEGGGTA